MTSSSDKRRGCMPIMLLVVIPVAALLAGFILYSLRIPADSPLARMYRTEVDLRSLVKAVEMYRDAYGVLPPPGEAGLRAAAEHLSRKVNYLPDGPPPDAWGRAYRYVPHTAYDAPGSEALRGANRYYDPEGFQLYSVGGDGDAGRDGLDAQADNIVSWDRFRAWRETYHSLQRQYGK